MTGGRDIPRCGVGGVPALPVRWGILVVVVVACWWVSVCQAATDRRDVVNAARCRVRCLKHSMQNSEVRAFLFS